MNNMIIGENNEMRVKKFNYYACDFETTVFEGQEYTEVWSACWVQLYSNDEPEIVGSIEEFLLGCLIYQVIIYYIFTISSLMDRL